MRTHRARTAERMQSNKHAKEPHWRRIYLSVLLWLLVTIGLLYGFSSLFND